MNELAVLGTVIFLGLVFVVWANRPKRDNEEGEFLFAEAPYKATDKKGRTVYLKDVWCDHNRQSKVFGKLFKSGTIIEIDDSKPIWDTAIKMPVATIRQIEKARYVATSAIGGSSIYINNLCKTESGTIKGWDNATYVYVIDTEEPIYDSVLNCFVELADIPTCKKAEGGQK